MMNPSSSSTEPSSALHGDNQEGVTHMRQVVLLSDGEHDTMVAERRVARIRRRPQIKTHHFKVLPGSTILTISSESSEGEGPNVDPKLVKSFHDINLGEKLPTIATSSTSLVTVEVQTEISIPPNAILERTMVDMAVNKLISTRSVPTNQSNQGAASMQGLGDSSVSLPLPPCPLEQPTMKDNLMTSKKIVATKKMIFGQPYEVAATMSASAISVAPCLLVLEAEKIILGQNFEVRTHEDVSSSSASTSTSFKPCCPPAYNTRSRTKVVEKVVGDNL